MNDGYDGMDASWAEPCWDVSPNPQEIDDINDAIEEASMLPLDVPTSDSVGLDTSTEFLGNHTEPPLDSQSLDHIGVEQPSGLGEEFSGPAFESPRTSRDDICDAIAEASAIPVGTRGEDPALAMPEDDPFSHCIQEPRSPGIELPPGMDVIVLDLLPISTISVDDAGRAQIEPDPVSMGNRHDEDRESAEFLVSWLNETGGVRDAIEHAISSGSARMEMLMRQYDDLLVAAGYDRSAPDVEQCDMQIRSLNDAIGHAKEVLDDIGDRPRRP